MQVFIKNTRLYFKGFLGFLCCGDPCWRAQLYLSEERFDRGTWWGGYTYTLQMVSFYESCNCVWWNWLSIKRAPSAICSNRKWVGQIWHPSRWLIQPWQEKTLRDAQRSGKTCFQVQTPVPTLGFGRSGWRCCTSVTSSRDSLSTLTAFFHSHLPWLLALISLEERSIHTLLSTESLRTLALW